VNSDEVIFNCNKKEGGLKITVLLEQELEHPEKDDLPSRVTGASNTKRNHEKHQVPAPATKLHRDNDCRVGFPKRGFVEPRM
jgi:hypothetical protein